MMDWINKFLSCLNEKGFPIPLLRDPKVGVGSISFTMLFISFNVVLMGLIGKISKFLDNVDLSNAIWFFTVCAGLYFGRSIQKNDKNITIDNK